MRKSKWSEHRVYLGTSLPNSIFGEIEQLAKESNLGKAQIARALVIRGLAAHYRDGQLSNEDDTSLVEGRTLPVLGADMAADPEPQPLSVLTTVKHAA